MNKIVVCKECGARFIRLEGCTNTKDTCKTCLSKSVKDQDAFIVAPINITKLLVTLRGLTNDRLIVNSLLELDFISNRAYMNGYISEEFYDEVCTECGFTPKYNSWKTLNDDIKVYDDSESAKQGFNYEIYARVSND